MAASSHSAPAVSVPVPVIEAYVRAHHPEAKTPAAINDFVQKILALLAGGGPLAGIIAAFLAVFNPPKPAPVPPVPATK